jgi:ubiquitin fusion degradation protein 1
MMDWGYGSAAPPRRDHRQFLAQYHCRSTAFAGKDVNSGDKVFLPPSALDRLARMNVEYPMLFEVTNTIIGKRTHCGVLEFSAEEGYCYMPYWMMENLLVRLKKPTFIKLF